MLDKIIALMAGKDYTGLEGLLQLTGPDFLEILNTLNSLVVILDRQGNVIYFNKWCENLTGYDSDEIIGSPLWERLVPEEHVDVVKSVFMEEKFPRSAKSYWLTKSGERRLIVWSNTLVSNSNYVVGTGIDITDLKESRELLSESQSMIGAILDAAVDGIIIIDDKGIISTFNPGAERLFGYSKEEIVGKNVRILMPSPYSEEHDAYLARYMESGKKKIIGIGREVEGKRKDGTVFPLYISVGEMTVAGRKMFTGIVHDLTPLKKIENDLRAKSEQLEKINREKSLILEQMRDTCEYLDNILKYSADAIVVIGMDDIIRSWNEGAEKIFGYKQEEIVGKHFGILLPEHRKQENELDYIRSRVESEGALTNYETERVAKDGTVIVVSLTSTLLRDNKGNAIGRSAILRDVTKIKDLELENLQKERLAAVGEMSAVVAHEIKNPLAGISSAIQVLYGQLDPKDEKRNVINDINHEIKRLDKIVKQFLAYSRPYTISKCYIDVNDIFSRVRSLYDSELKEKKLGLEINNAITRPVNVDPAVVEQILLNLVRNAVEASSEGGKIVINSKLKDSCLFLSVSDEGGGISEEVLKRVFLPFFTTKSVGTGLGLPICKKLAELHGGSIDVNTEPGKGTTVNVYLKMEK